MSPKFKGLVSAGVACAVALSVMPVAGAFAADKPDSTSSATPEFKLHKDKIADLKLSTWAGEYIFTNSFADEQDPDFAAALKLGTEAYMKKKKKAVKTEKLLKKFTTGRTLEPYAKGVTKIVVKDDSIVYTVDGKDVEVKYEPYAVIEGPHHDKWETAYGFKAVGELPENLKALTYFCPQDVSKADEFLPTSFKFMPLETTTENLQNFGKVMHEKEAFPAAIDAKATKIQLMNYVIRNSKGKVFYKSLEELRAAAEKVNLEEVAKSFEKKDGEKKEQEKAPKTGETPSPVVPLALAGGACLIATSVLRRRA